MTTPTSPRRPDERGAVAVVTAILCVVLFTVAAMVVNLGLARDVRNGSQNAADASALAAANSLYATGSADLNAAAAEAKSYALVNYNVALTQWDSCTDGSRLALLPSGAGSCISFGVDGSGQPAFVRVLIPGRSVSMALAGAKSITVNAAARATIVPGVSAACSICIIGPGTHSLGNMDIVASSGDIFIDGTVALQPNGHVTASSGTVDLAGNLPSKGTVSSPRNVNQTPMPDPFASLAAPTFSTSPFLSTDTSHSNMCNGPGVYADPTATGCTTLPNGLYVIVSGTFNPSGIVAPAATFYFTCADAVTPKKSATTYTPRPCTSGESGAGWDLGGSGTATLTAPTAGNVANGSVAGMLLWYDRQNTTGVTLNGSPNLTISGTVYMASAGVTYKGSGSVYNSQAQFVVNDISGNGNPGTLQVNPTTSSVYKSAAGSPALDR